MVGAEYTIYKRDSEGKRGNLIDKFTSLKIEQRWTEPSKWSLDSTGLSRIPVALGDGIIIYRNGTWFFSGIVEAANEHGNEAEQGIITWHAEGRDMTSLLERRLALPDPVGLQFDESIQDVLKDAAEGAMRRYVERNAGASAATGRRLNGLVVDQITPDANGDMRAYRLKTLDKVCAEIGEGELSPEITWNPDTGIMEFEVHPRREKADDVVFSPEYGTVISWDIKQKLPKKNAIWAISGGSGNDQVVTFSKHDESIAAFGRFEGFIKDSAQIEAAKDGQPAVTSSDVTNILLSKANEELRKNAATETYTVDVREGVNTLFYDHWRCGDRVTCIIDGESIISTIDSVSIVFTDDGEKVQATIGDVEKGIFASLFEDIAELQKAVVTEQAVSSAAAITSGGGGGSSVPSNPAAITDPNFWTWEAQFPLGVSCYLVMGDASGPADAPAKQLYNVGNCAYFVEVIRHSEYAISQTAIVWNQVPRRDSKYMRTYRNGWSNWKEFLLNDDSGWISFTLLNSWNDWGGWGLPGYRKVNGRVQLRGLIRKPDTNYLQTIAVLPAGFRPVNNSMFPVVHHVAYGAIKILTDGTVGLEFTTQTAAGAWLGLQGISFFVG